MQFSIADAVFDSGFRPPAADAVFDCRCSFLSQMQFSIADAVFYLRCSFRSQKASCKYSAYFRFTDTTDPYRVLTITETKTHYRSIPTDTATSSTRHQTKHPWYPGTKSLHFVPPECTRFMFLWQPELLVQSLRIFS